MKILAFGSYDARSHPRVAVLLEGLRAHGDRVVEVNRPLGLDTATRVAILDQPWRLPVLAARVLRTWTWLAVHGRRAYLRERPDAVLVGYLGHFDVRLARLLFRRAAIVLDQLIFARDTAADRGQSQAWKAWLLGRLDRGAVRAADLVVIDTPEHRSLLASLSRSPAQRAVVVRVGATRAWFEAGERAVGGWTGPGDRSVRVIFFGLFTPLQGAPVIGAALGLLADLPELSVTMVGNGQDLARTRAEAAGNPRVTWLDWIGAEELPHLVAEHDICLGIFGTGAKALRVVPNKVYQGAACCCAVVTSDTAPQRAALGEAAVLVPPGDARALAEALRALVAEPAELARLRRAARARAVAAFGAEQVVVPLRTALAAGAPRPPSRPRRPHAQDPGGAATRPGDPQTGNTAPPQE